MDKIEFDKLNKRWYELAMKGIYNLASEEARELKSISKQLNDLKEIPEK